jgi:hypothetical protein
VRSWHALCSVLLQLALKWCGLYSCLLVACYVLPVCKLWWRPLTCTRARMPSRVLSLAPPLRWNGNSPVSTAYSSTPHDHISAACNRGSLSRVYISCGGCGSLAEERFICFSWCREHQASCWAKHIHAEQAFCNSPSCNTPWHRIFLPQLCLAPQVQSTVGCQ